VNETGTGYLLNKSKSNEVIDMRSLFLAMTLTIIAAPVWAEEVTGPKEVGSTTMPPGQYHITEQISKKSYSLTVTDKGNMILGPAPADVEVKAGAPAAAAPTATTAATSGDAAAAAAKPATANDALNGLMKQGLQRGMTELVKQGGTKQIQKYMK
jgi:hypothetical protein